LIYTNLAFPASATIPNTVTNYAITGFPNGALQDYLGNSDNLRYPNDQGIGNGGTFTLQGSGNNRHHLTRTPRNELAQQFVIVNTGTAPLPMLRYKMFFDDQCYSCRDYSAGFNHGCFIGSTDEAEVDSEPTKQFVATLIQGKGANDFINNLKSEGLDDYAQKNF